MFNSPLSLFADARPQTTTLRADRGTGARPRPAQLPAHLPATAKVIAQQGHRRWTVVIPRRLTARTVQAQADAEALCAALPPTPDPIRFGPQATMFGMIAAVASGLYVYTEKHAAASLDRQIAHAFQATNAAHQQSSLLHAEWAVLNNPDRLHPLADRYLNLQATRATQFVQVADLRSHLPGILYGPPPPADDDTATPGIAGKRLLAMATAPATPEAMPASDEEVATPIVTAPSKAIRVLAHAGAMPDIIGAGAQAALPDAESPETGLLGDVTPKPERIARAVQHMAQAPSTVAHSATRPAMAALPPAAPRLLARNEPKPRVLHQPTVLSPELVHMLMLPHASYATSWLPRSKPSAIAPVPQHHVEYGRSDPPHFLSLPPATPRQPEAQYASAEPLLRPTYQQRVQAWAPPVYRPPAPYYRPPYWGYNANPYGGAYMPPPGPGYPVYQ